MLGITTGKDFFPNIPISPSFDQPIFCVHGHFINRKLEDRLGMFMSVRVCGIFSILQLDLGKFFGSMPIFADLSIQGQFGLQIYSSLLLLFLETPVVNSCKRVAESLSPRQ